MYSKFISSSILIQNITTFIVNECQEEDWSHNNGIFISSSILIQKHYYIYCEWMSRRWLVSQQWSIWQSSHLVFEQFRFSLLIEFPFLEFFIEACIELILMFIRLSVYLSFMFIEEFLESIHGIFLEFFIEFQALSTVCWFDMIQSSTNFPQHNGRPINWTSREIIDACSNAVWILILACTVLFYA